MKTLNFISKLSRCLASGNSFHRCFGSSNGLNSLSGNDENSDIKTFLLIGAPGVGKGTFAKILAPAYNAELLDTGRLLRQIAGIEQMSALNNGIFTKLNDETISSIKESMASGELISDEILLPIIYQYMLYLKDKNLNYICDGFPRTMSQAKWLYNKKHFRFDCIIDLQLPEEIIIERLKGRRSCTHCGKVYNICDCDKINQTYGKLGIHMKPNKPKIDGKCDDCGTELITRKSDNIDIFMKRLDIWKQETVPMIRFLKAHSMQEVNGQNFLAFHIQRMMDDGPRFLKEVSEIVGEPVQQPKQF